MSTKTVITVPAGKISLLGLKQLCVDKFGVGNFELEYDVIILFYFPL